MLFVSIFFVIGFGVHLKNLDEETNEKINLALQEIKKAPLIDRPSLWKRNIDRVLHPDKADESQNQARTEAFQEMQKMKEGYMQGTFQKEYKPREEDKYLVTFNNSCKFLVLAI